MSLVSVFIGTCATATVSGPVVFAPGNMNFADLLLNVTFVPNNFTVFSGVFTLLSHYVQTMFTVQQGQH